MRQYQHLLELRNFVCALCVLSVQFQEGSLLRGASVEPTQEVFPLLFEVS